MNKTTITRHIVHELFAVAAAVFALAGILVAFAGVIAAGDSEQLSALLAGVAIMILGASNLCFFGHVLLAPPQEPKP